jgi:hypothetical protein
MAVARIYTRDSPVPSLNQEPDEYKACCVSVIGSYLSEILRSPYRIVKIDLAYHLMSFIHVHAYPFVFTHRRLVDTIILKCREFKQETGIPERLHTVLDSVLETLSA